MTIIGSCDAGNDDGDNSGGDPVVDDLATRVPPEFLEPLLSLSTQPLTQLQFRGDPGESCRDRESKRGTYRKCPILHTKIATMVYL